MSEHTPGPWEVRNMVPWGYRRTEDGIEIPGSPPSIVGATGTVLHPHVKGRTDEEINANLTLAAAAPDLLEAAKDALDYLAPEHNRGHTGKWTDAMKERLHIAIAKAESR